MLNRYLGRPLKDLERRWYLLYNVRPDKLDLLFLLTHFQDLGASGRSLFISKNTTMHQIEDLGAMHMHMHRSSLT